ncbi:type VI secretion protein [Escherichia coli]|nr:type VI secretion protein [Escherichia coli]EFN8662545.1 type VI secretion protein [Escherichia coli O2]EFI0637123.1 type VI secretion protein [Escherichia coli]EHE9978668.1 type VI secretion protein [Escherichia coli]EJV5037673.1 type VI secretion protein [Escherichia coli]
MAGVISGVSASSREFIKLTIDGKVIKGNSPVDKFEEYFEGHSPQAFRAFSGIDGAVFDITTVCLRVTKQTQEFLELFFKRGEKNIDIEILRSESTKSSSSYSSFKVIYCCCRLHDVMLSHDHDSNLVLEMSFSPENSVSLEMNIPSPDGKSTEKLGPITYSLEKQKLI